MKSPDRTNQEDVDEKIFVQFGLIDKIGFPHPNGSIRAKSLGKTQDGMSEMLWGLRRGSNYPPETHSHGHILTIKHGSGIISIDGEEKVYAPGDTFDIAGNVPHGFISVTETTIVSQKQPTDRFIEE